MNTFRVTPVGRRVATSGIRPITAHFLLDFSAQRASGLASLISMRSQPSQPADQREDLEFILLFSALTSPEYAARHEGGRRFIPYQIIAQSDSTRADRLQEHLPIRPWDREAPAAMAAELACDWMAGTSLRELERRFQDLRSGALHGLFRDIAQILYGWAEVLYAASAPSLPTAHRAAALPGPESMRDALRALLTIIRATAVRIEAGLPEEILWTSQVRSVDGRKVLPRPVAIALANAAMVRPEDLLDRGRTNDLVALLRPVFGAANEVLALVRQVAERYRATRTEVAKARQLRRLPADSRALWEQLYANTGVAFENSLDEALHMVGIVPIARDEPGKSAFPDFVLAAPAGGHVVIECKTSAGSVDLNAATDVLRKASLHGYDDAYKVTVCKPYLSPDVPRKLTQSRRLAVVNAEEFAEVMMRLLTLRGSQADFFDWCCQGGHITSESFVQAVPSDTTNAAA